MSVLTTDKSELTMRQKFLAQAREDTMWWREFATCKDQPLELFCSPDSDEPESPYPPQEAATLCHQCPVRTECLAYAMKYDECGVWGGTTEYQRKLLKRWARRKSCPGCSSTSVVMAPRGSNQVCLMCGVSWYVYTLT